MNFKKDVKSCDSVSLMCRATTNMIPRSLWEMMIILTCYWRHNHSPGSIGRTAHTCLSTWYRNVSYYVTKSEPWSDNCLKHKQQNVIFSLNLDTRIHLKTLPVFLGFFGIYFLPILSFTKFFCDIYFWNWC
jgi:hypothetical protein